MHYDKKNLSKPYQSHVFLRGFRDVRLNGTKISSKVWLTIENLGFRPLAICNIKLKATLHDNSVINFKSGNLKIFEGQEKDSALITNPVILNSNTIIGFAVEFFSIENYNQHALNNFDANKERVISITGEILLSTNSKIYFDATQRSNLND